MIKREKNICYKNSDVISASEIGQYEYCSVSWYLKRCGYKPESSKLEIGTTKHTIFGEIIDNIHIKLKRSSFFFLIGYLSLIISVFLILYKVILWIIY
jgi:hypothetical protein